MFGFKKKKTKEQLLAEKASEIIEKTHYPLLRTAWDEYRYIKRSDPAYDKEDNGENLYNTPEYFALKKLVEHEGHFDRFSIYELHLLKSLQEGYLRYDEAMHVLMDHHNDEQEAQHLFAAHPNLHKHLPKQFDNTRQVIEVLVEITHQFRWEIEHFSEENKDAIAEAIQKIIKQAAKKGA